ncbi:MAG: T9SS type A sorting domain-containing protein [Bacteroidetes bacterium]|nr:T9SS type A sorting domain-containing protein [Bacteroidota bacterium]
MKKCFILILFISIFNSSQAQIQSSCVSPPLLTTEYKRDIAQLASSRLFLLQSPDTIFVKIPQAYIDTISEGLAAIFNATSIPERDSVFNLYCVHNLNPFDGFGAYAGFLIKVDTNYSWTNAWQNLITITGDPLMDTLTTKYNLKISQFYNWTIGNYAELSVDSSWNIFALMDSLEMVPGVITVEQNSYVGVAGKISYNTNGNSRYYDFYFEYADCFDGCDAYRKWMFKVNPDCSVEYLGIDNWCYWDQFGTPGQCPFPAPLNCNTFTPVKEIVGQDANILISPNPTNGKFQIEISGIDLVNPSNLEIYNMQGELIFKTSISSLKSYLDLGSPAKGIYLVKISNKQNDSK